MEVNSQRGPPIDSPAVSSSAAGAPFLKPSSGVGLPRKVHHNYHDRSNDLPLSGAPTCHMDHLITIMMNEVLTETGRNGGLFSSNIYSPGSCQKNLVPFHAKLFVMLERAEKDGYQNIVSWQPHGRCFSIRDNELFLNHILPRFFPSITKVSSFLRQVRRTRLGMLPRTMISLSQLCIALISSSIFTASSDLHVEETSHRTTTSLS
jgi:HSF-type DNA-binding